MKNEEIDRLLEVYCKGIIDMDPKTALPFWDYDFGPLFGDLWAKRMIKAIKIILKKIEKGETSYKKIADKFKGIAVPRKELIYSLPDLKVGEIKKKDRMMFVDFWWKIIKEKIANEDYLCEQKTNLLKIDLESVKKKKWTGPKIVKEVGKITMALNSLAYGLYSDIFACECFENCGPYKIDENIMVIKTWTNLQPTEIWPETKQFRYKDIKIYCIYRDMEYTIDIYNHQWYSANTKEKLEKVRVEIDGKLVEDLDKLKEIAEYLAKYAVKQFIKYRLQGFEKLKELWIKQRSHQFKKFFLLAGLKWDGPEMKEMIKKVKGKEILKDPYWDFNKPKEKLFAFWTKIFDPRLDTYYSEWPRLFKTIIQSS